MATNVKLVNNPLAVATNGKLIKMRLVWRCDVWMNTLTSNSNSALFDFCLFFKYCEVCGIVKPPHRPNSTLPCGVCLIEKFASSRNPCN